ncbi:hypothetical protein BDW74DRAFT_172859 [Aspergillus multicolor]|uniref:uncharacterized protein n=1 Tax=Aspergillus multicolor TaxID=41759 RepID=UPI003CCD15E4
MQAPYSKIRKWPLEEEVRLLRLREKYSKKMTAELFAEKVSKHFPDRSEDAISKKLKSMMNKVGWHNCSGEKIKTKVLKGHKDWWAAVLPEGSDARGPTEFDYSPRKRRLRSTSTTARAVKDAGMVDSLEDSASESWSDDESEAESVLDCESDTDSDYTPDSAPGSGYYSNSKGKYREISENVNGISGSIPYSVSRDFHSAKEKDVVNHTPETPQIQDPFGLEIEPQIWMTKRSHDGSMDDEFSMNQRRVKRPCQNWNAANLTDTNPATAAAEGVEARKISYLDSQRLALTESKRTTLDHTKSTVPVIPANAASNARTESTYLSVDKISQPETTTHRTDGGYETVASETRLKDNRQLGLTASQLEDISFQVRNSVAGTLEDYVFRITCSHKAMEAKLAAEVQQKEVLARTVKDCSEHIDKLQTRLDFYTRRMSTQAQQVSRLSDALKDGGAVYGPRTNEPGFHVT